MKFIEKLSNLFSLQLFLFLLSLPILIAWGLPVSVMVLIGTPIFAPFLTVFLFISMLIFMCALCSIPYSFLVVILKWCTIIWDFCLSYSTKQWLVYFAMPSKMIIATWGVANCWILLKFLQFAPRKRFYLLCFYTLLCLILLLGYKQFFSPSNHVFSSKKGKLQVLFAKKSIIFVDAQFFSQKNDYNDWVQYTLIPVLAKKVGHIHIDTIIVQQLSKRTLVSLQTISQHCPIKHIIIPENPFFSSDVDKLTNCCAILTCVKEPYTFFSYNNYSVCFSYDEKRKRLIIG